MLGIYNYGSGPQNIHTGSGDQNNNTGSGNQFNRSTFHGLQLPSQQLPSLLPPK
jgi:hypothetical protein